MGKLNIWPQSLYNHICGQHYSCELESQLHCWPGHLLTWRFADPEIFESFQFTNMGEWKFNFLKKSFSCILILILFKLTIRSFIHSNIHTLWFTNSGIAIIFLMTISAKLYYHELILKKKLNLLSVSSKVLVSKRFS